MNKELREEMEFLITCDDKAITPDVRDDVEMTLKYIDELEDKINKAIEYIYQECKWGSELDTHGDYLSTEELLNILRGEDNE